MAKNYIAQGILVYSTLYVNTILFLITFLTGRWIFLFFILLTFGLVAYMSLLTAKESDHLMSVGKWAEEAIESIYNKTVNLF